MDSKALFEEASKLMPGGVNSPVRAFGSVGGDPIFFERASGSKMTDVSGKEYIDYVLSWGPLVIGHAHPSVVTEIKNAAEQSTSFGAPSRAEIDLARVLIEAVPGLECVRMVNSGTEATMSAIRLARGATGRDKILKFQGCYHGHADSFLTKAGSGMATLGIPTSPGVPAACVQDTITCTFNDLDGVQKVFESHPGQIAAVILEPVGGNMGVVPPVDGFLQGLRDLTRDDGALLIFDEVMTGFRASYTCAQGLFGVTPDLTCLGKVIGGGLPVGAYGGRADLMNRMAPSGPIYQAGTLSGNPLAMRAGLKTLEGLGGEAGCAALTETTTRLARGLQEAAHEAEVPARVQQVGSMFSIFYGTRDPVTSWDDVEKTDGTFYIRWFRAMLEEGLYFAPSPYEAAFMSTAHTSDDIDYTLEAHERALRKAKTAS